MSKDGSSFRVRRVSRLRESSILTRRFTRRQIPPETQLVSLNCKHAVTDYYSLVYVSSLACVISFIQTYGGLAITFARTAVRKPVSSWFACGDVRPLVKGVKSHMNYSHRSDRNLRWFAGKGFVVSIPVHLGRPERKGLQKDCIGAFLAILCGFATVGIMGCNTGALSAKTNGLTTPLISVAIKQALPTSMIAGNSATVSATVTNDPADAGVDWVVTCASTPKCGNFTPSHTANGATTIYTAPPGIPSKNQVAVTALSTTDRSKSAATTVTIMSTVTSIFITPPVPASAAAGSVLNLGATVAGDPANLGVDWTVVCPTVSGPVVCSSSGLHSIAGGTVPFIVPETVTIPGTSQGVSLVGSSVVVTAFATADHSVSASASFTITAGIAISITQAPPPTMLTNATAPVIAVVSNDTTNAGVSWLVTCDKTPCGTIMPIQTASGVAATYTAPATVPSPNPAPGLTVTIFAFANATGPSGNGSTLNASTTVNIIAPISVSITQGIQNGTIIANATASLIATVNNDYSNAGVDWTVSCGSAGACGSFSLTHTASGVATTYTAPSAPPSGNTVTITATSTADPTKSAQQQNVTVTTSRPPNSLLQGQFVLSLSAKNSQNGPFILGGILSGDGNGLVSGQFDVADARGNAFASSSFRTDSASPSTYSIGRDGRGQITLILNTNILNTNFGVPVSASTSTLTLSVVFVTPQHALLTETDTFGDATGTLDLQNTTDLASFAGLNGTYSLQLTGSELSGSGFFVAAAITSQASGFTTTFTGYTADQSANGAITSVPFTVGTQSFSSFFSHQTGELALNSVILGLPKPFSLDLWLIDANHFVVTDFADVQSGSAIVSGLLTAQPASPSISGTFAFTEAGATSAAQPQVAGGILSCGSAGNVDVVPLSGTAAINQVVSATCSAPTNGRGLISITGAGISQFAAYPTLDQRLYLIELDGGGAGTSGPAGAGVAYQQTLPPPISTSALSGNYASNFTAATTLGSQRLIGRTISDAIAAVLSGSADVNSFTTTPPAVGSPSFNATLSGSYTAASDGRFPLTFTITPATGQPIPQILTLNPACYIVDANTCLLLGLDVTAPGVGILQLQNTGL